MSPFKPDANHLCEKCHQFKRNVCWSVQRNALLCFDCYMLTK